MHRQPASSTATNGAKPSQLMTPTNLYNPTNKETPEAISTISKYRPPSLTHGLGHPATEEKASAAGDREDFFSSGSKGNGLGLDNPALKTVLRNILSESIQRYQQPSSSSSRSSAMFPQTPGGHELIEEETEILALISLYLQQHTDPDDLLLDPVLMKTLKMKVLSKLLEESMSHNNNAHAPGPGPGNNNGSKPATPTSHRPPSSVRSLQKTARPLLAGGAERGAAGSPLEVDSSLVESAVSNFERFHSQDEAEQSNSPLGKVVNKTPVPLTNARPTKIPQRQPGQGQGQGIFPPSMAIQRTDEAVPGRGSSPKRLPVATDISPPTQAQAQQAEPTDSSPIVALSSTPAESQQRLKKWTRASPQSESPTRKKAVATAAPSPRDPNKRYHNCSICAQLPKRPAINFSELKRQQQQAAQQAAMVSPPSSSANRPNPNSSSTTGGSGGTKPVVLSPTQRRYLQSAELQSHDPNDPAHLEFCEPCARQHLRQHQADPDEDDDGQERPMAVDELGDGQQQQQREEERRRLVQKVAEETERQLRDWKDRFQRHYGQPGSTSSFSQDPNDSLPTIQSQAHAQSGRSQSQPPPSARSADRTTSSVSEVAARAILRSISAEPMRPAPSLAVEAASSNKAGGANPSGLLTPESHKNGQPALTSPPASEAKGPYFIVKSDPTSFSAVKRRELSRDAVREVTSRLCQLAVDLEKSAVLADETFAEDGGFAVGNLSHDLFGESTSSARPPAPAPVPAPAQPANPSANPSSGSGRSSEAMLSEVIQLIRQQSEEIHRLKDFQQSLLSGSWSSAQSPAHASRPGSFFSNTQESLQSLHPLGRSRSQDEADNNGRDLLDPAVSAYYPQHSLTRIDEEDGDQESHPQQQAQAQALALAQLDSFLGFFGPGAEAAAAEGPDSSAAATTARKSQRYPMSFEDVQQVVSILEEKFHVTRYQLAQRQQQQQDRGRPALASPTAHRRRAAQSALSSSSAASSSQLEVEVVLARHLPAMKHMSRSSDPYAELILLTFHPVGPALGQGGQAADWRENIHEVLGHFTDVDYNVLNGNCVIRADVEFAAMEQLYGCTPVVIGYQKTSVQAATMYPSWRETFSFFLDQPRPIEDGEEEGGRGEEVLVLWCLIRDSTRNGFNSMKFKDEIIVQTAYQFDQELFLGGAHFKLALSLFPPHALKWRKGRAAIDSRAELKLAVRARMTAERQAAMLLDEMAALLGQLKQLLRSPNPPAQVEAGAPDYWLDGAVVLRVYRVLKFLKSFALLPDQPAAPSNAQTQAHHAPASLPSQPAAAKRRLSASPQRLPTHDDPPAQVSGHNNKRAGWRPPSVFPPPPPALPPFTANHKRSRPNEPADQSLHSINSQPPLPAPAMPAPARSPIRVVGLAERHKSPPFQKTLRDYSAPASAGSRRRASSAPPVGHYAHPDNGPNLRRDRAALSDVSSLTSGRTGVVPGPFPRTSSASPTAVSRKKTAPPPLAQSLPLPAQRTTAATSSRPLSAAASLNLSASSSSGPFARPTAVTASRKMPPPPSPKKRPDLSIFKRAGGSIAPAAGKAVRR